jgi:colicin import membrane protein
MECGMSATFPLPDAAAERLDPFRYGWRYVTTPGPDGKPTTEMVPLTLEQALHPAEEDKYMISDAHARDCRYLADAFETQLVDTPRAVVLFDMRVAWDAEGTYAHGPDVSVVFNVRERKDWRTFNVVEEGTRPALIIEVTSESTRVNDVKEKLREYAEVGVRRYVIVDADEEGAERRLAFRHYQLPPGATAYDEVPVSANGRVWLPEVRLWLGTEAGRIVCIDDRGNRIGDHAEVSRAKAEAERRALAAAQRAEIAELRAAEAEQTVAAEVEARMADALARREAERRAAEAEKIAAEQTERLKQLEAELQRLRGDGPAAG